jgi:hypothetical protein
LAEVCQFKHGAAVGRFDLAVPDDFVKSLVAAVQIVRTVVDDPND